mgnify:CR=1 FL=1
MSPRSSDRPWLRAGSALDLAAATRDTRRSVRRSSASSASVFPCTSRLVTTTAAAFTGTDSRTGSSTSGPMSRSARSRSRAAREDDHPIAALQHQVRSRFQQLLAPLHTMHRQPRVRHSGLPGPRPVDAPTCAFSTACARRLKCAAEKIPPPSLPPASACSSALASLLEVRAQHLRTDPGEKRSARGRRTRR